MCTSEITFLTQELASRFVLQQTLFPFTYFIRPIFFTTFLYMLTTRFPFPLSFADASQTLANISPTHPLFHDSLFLSYQPSTVSKLREQAFVELLMERFHALPRLSGASSLSFIFSLLLEAPIATFFPISHDRKIPTSYSADFAEKISSRNDFDNSVKVETYEDDLRTISTFPRFPFSYYSATFYHSLYRCMY